MENTLNRGEYLTGSMVKRMIPKVKNLVGKEEPPQGGSEYKYVHNGFVLTREGRLDLMDSNQYDYSFPPYALPYKGRGTEDETIIVDATVVIAMIKHDWQG